jgi:hypothetical protein
VDRDDPDRHLGPDLALDQGRTTLTPLLPTLQEEEGPGKGVGIASLKIFNYFESMNVVCLCLIFYGLFSIVCKLILKTLQFQLPLFLFCVTPQWDGCSCSVKEGRVH